MTRSPSEVGARAEAAIAAALGRTGRTVFIPLFAPHARVDLVFEDEYGLHRVQCKTSVVRGDIVGFRTCSNTNNHPLTYRGQVEYFGVYSPELDAYTSSLRTWWRTGTATSASRRLATTNGSVCTGPPTTSCSPAPVPTGLSAARRPAGPEGGVVPWAVGRHLALPHHPTGQKPTAW